MIIQELIQDTLWQAASRISRDTENRENRLFAPGLVFLRYMSHAFEHLSAELQEITPQDSPNSESDLPALLDYLGENLLYIPEKSRWDYVMQHINHLSIGKILNEAMEDIERCNPPVRQALPRAYSSPEIREDQLILFLKKLGSIPTEYYKTAEILRNVFEHFIRNFQLSAGQRQDPRCTTETVDRLMVEMVEPAAGTIFDPCCGFGSRLVEVRNYLSKTEECTAGVEYHGCDTSFSNFQLARMNLAIHELDGSHILRGEESCIERDKHQKIKADAIFCSPPYEHSSFHWLQYIVSHLAVGGFAGVILPTESLQQEAGYHWEKGLECESECNLFDRRYLVEHHWVDCIVTLPDHIFPPAAAPACLWILARGRGQVQPRPFRQRDKEILFIDISSGSAGDSGGPGSVSAPPALSMEVIRQIASVYHQWRNKEGEYTDVKGFCKAVGIKAIRRQNFDLTPQRYI